MEYRFLLIHEKSWKINNDRTFTHKILESNVFSRDQEFNIHS